MELYRIYIERTQIEKVSSIRTPMLIRDERTETNLMHFKWKAT